MSRNFERGLLQAVIAILCLSPLGFGLLGMVRGTEAFGGPSVAGVDSHFRYLSGIFFGIGIMAVSCIPRIERQTARFAWVVLFVVIGGLARLLGFFVEDAPHGAHYYAVFVELVITPLMGLWQRRVARRF
ncbi:DUF4345 domain-containing protein [Glacieibacterium sp.]|uniref:DUF4345 domain-containing protein n=1 Tax=Glacieibacterium sp. TaxID=2860237 RepID=UPI003AFFD9D2